MARDTTRISDRITEQNRETLAAAGMPYQCGEIGCEAEPTHVCGVWAESTPTEEKTRWLCAVHAGEHARGAA